MKKTIVIVIGLLFAKISLAITPIELKESRLATLEWFKKYNIAVDFKAKRDSIEQFTSLFGNKEINIYNDYIALNDYDFNHSTISVLEYAKLRTKTSGFYNMKHEIWNVKKQNEQLITPELIEYVYTFDKVIWFEEKDNYTDNRFEYPKMTLNQEITLVYDVKEKMIRARTLITLNQIKPFVILHIQTDSLKAVNRISSIEEIEQMCQEKSTPFIRCYYVEAKHDHKLIIIKSDTILNSVGLGIWDGLGGFTNSLDKDTRFDIQKKTFASMGVNMSYYRLLSFNKNQRWGVDTGLRFKWNSYGLLTNYNESYNSIDPDGGNYLRIINISDYSESINSYSIGIPIGVRYDYYNTKRICLWTRAGIETQYVIATNTNTKANIKASAKYSGYYDWLFETTIDQNGVYDFGNYELSPKSSTLSAKNSLELGIYAAIGYSYFISQNISIDLSILYNTMVFNTLKSETNYSLSTDKNNLTSTYHLYGNMNTNSINLQIQLNYHF